MSNERRTALVTGSSRGIGRAIAERLAANGIAVVINYAQSPKLAQETVNGIIDKGGVATAIQADIMKPADVRRLFEEAEKAVGPLDGASLSPFNRVGTSQEVADVAAFLVSDGARWITGQNVQANGGVV